MRRLPLFPLPLVLFPGAPLPLHIFEPRYRQMLADCLAADRQFGLIYLPPQVRERDLPPGHVGCVARVSSSVLLDDGRSNLVATGVERFALERLAETGTPYHVGEIREYADLPEDAARLAADGGRVRALFERVARAARALTDDDEPVPALPADDAQLSFAVASHIDLDSPARQRLLQSRSPSGRLAELAALLEAAVGALEERADVHRRAKSNGHGPHHADG